MRCDTPSSMRRRRALVVAMLCAATDVTTGLVTPKCVVRLTDAASRRPVVLIGTVRAKTHDCHTHAID